MNTYLGTQNRSEYRCETFGGCPECGQSTGFTHCGRKRWYFCHAHKTKWCGGEVLLCHWKIETTKEFAQGEAEINSYREVEPLAPLYPVELKVQMEMTDLELAQHLRALADALERSAEFQFHRMMSEA